MTTHDTPACAYYDRECRFCTALVRRFGGVLARHGIMLMPLQTFGAAALLGVADDRLLDEMRLRFGNGHVYGGADAVVQIARRIWWAWPLWLVSRVPGAMRSMRAVYGWIARHRGCANEVCTRIAVDR